MYAGTARAFPITDPANPPVVTNTPDEADLRNQLQLHNNFLAPAGGGWTITPRVSVSEVLNDNVFQTSSNRRFDLITLISPGITILGDTPRAQVTFDYQPSLAWYARTPSETGVSQQLAGTALFTIIPDEFYVDARAVSGVIAANGGFGAFGGYGGVNSVAGASLGGGSLGTGGSVGLSKQNQTQFSSLSLSPYWLHSFKDIGTAKIGYSINESSFSNTGSFLPLFFPTGSNAQRMTTNELFAQFQTGDYFGRIQDVVQADATKSTGSGATSTSSQATITNRTTYALYDWISVYGTIGLENISYAGTPSQHIADTVWGFGTTLIPNPDSSITIGYGHQNGATSIQFSGYYALTAHTTLSASYSTAVQTQLQQIQNQLNQTAINVNGVLVNSQTGQPIFLTNTALGVQAGLYKTSTFTFTATTVLDRDVISLTALYQNSSLVSSAANASAASNHGTTGAATWTRQIREDLTLATSLSYSVSTFTGSGTTTSIGAVASLQYLISETLTGNLRYAFFDQKSATPGQSIYQNLFLIGITKQF